MRGSLYPLTKRQRKIAEEAIDIIPDAIRGFQSAYPGISGKLANIDAVSVAHLAVVVASRTYNPKLSQLTTYFSRAIHNALLKELQKESVQDTAAHEEYRWNSQRRSVSQRTGSKSF